VVGPPIVGADANVGAGRDKQRAHERQDPGLSCELIAPHRHHALDLNGQARVRAETFETWFTGC
jgi:hypothetical protein